MIPNYLVLDLETTGLNWTKDSIVAVGLKNQDEVYQNYVYPNDLLELDLQGIDVLVMHNAKFDLKFIWNLLQPWFKQGGQIWCTMTAEYLLTGQQSKFAGLRDIAVNKYNCKERIKHINTYLTDNSKSILDMPIEEILEDVTNDVKDTEQVYLQQLELADKLKMLPLIEKHMDGVLGTTEMEINGIYIKKSIMEENKRLLENELDEYYSKLHQLIKPYWKLEDT